MCPAPTSRPRSTAKAFRARPGRSIAVAKAGEEDGARLIGGSCIVDPNGRVIAEAATLEDEWLVADLDLDLCRQGKEKMFKFALHRCPEHDTPITARAGVIEPAAAARTEQTAG
ncbi:MAG: nitrilase-related carbon-nitrogen hydrolase [Acetobacteraceae bacterium]